ncbi:MAG: HEAT repeat domain-containing protein [Candidatus Lokiarchaeota archaeon]|nr:HEAT repeat domain-containing protein [Candidatus Lokiarchaeota archaeon]
MSIFNEKIFEKIKNMDSRNAVESLLEILLTSNKWQERERAVKLLINYEDATNFTKVKNAYSNEIRTKIKLDLIDLLMKSYEKDAIPFLINQYRIENDWKVRKYIIESVGELDHPDILQFLVETLSDKDIETKKSAIILLSRRQAVHSSSLKILFEQLKHRNEEIVDLIINIIVKIGKSGKLDDILEYKKEGNININRAIPLVLGRMGDKNAKIHLLDFFEDSNSLVRLNAVQALAKFAKEPSDIDLLIKMLNDENEDVVQASVKALGIIGDKRAIKSFFELLKYDNESINKSVLNSLTKILKKSSSIKRIYEYAKKGNLNVRKETAILLGMIKNPDAIDTLIVLLNSKNSKIRRAATTSIIKIARSNASVMTNIGNALESKDWQIRKYIARIIGVLEKKDLILPLFSLLNDPKSGVRKAASKSLARFPENLVLEIAIEKLKQNNWRLRRAVVQLLVKIGTDKSLEPLIIYLNEDDPYIQRWVAKGMGMLKTIGNIEPLLIMLKNKDSNLRISAIKALANLGGEDKIKYLAERLGDDDWRVKREAEIALNTINPDWMNFL